MTISAEDTVVVSTVTLDVAIPILFPVHSRDELRVFDHTGALALLNVDYTVTLYPPAYATAAVVPLAGLVTKAEGQNVVILRVLPLTQPTQVYSANQILAAELQKAVDRSVMRDQQLDEKIERGILRPVAESDETPWTLPPKDTRANKVLGFDASGDIIAASDITNLAELEAALTEIHQAVDDAQDAADASVAASGSASGSAGAAAGSANSAALAANNATSILEDIQTFVAGLGSFTRRKFSGFAPGQTVIPIPSGFGNPTTMMVFFDSALLDYGGEYTAVSPNITLAQPIDSAQQEITLIEFIGVNITDALIKTQNLADLVDKKTARLNMELTKTQFLIDADTAINASTRVVYTSVPFTAARAFSLPAANGYNAGETIEIIDLAAAITGVNTMTINRSGADTINGANSVVVATSRGGVRLASDGVSKWSYAAPEPPVAVNGVLIGSTQLWNGPRLPAAYLWEDGTAVSRSTYSALLNAITLVSSGDTTAGNATITNVPEDLRGLGLIGAPIEGPGIQAGSTISAITATTVVLSANASATVASTAFRIFPHGAGNGSSTFNKPDGKGRANIGRDDMGGTAAGRVTSTGTGGPGVDATKLGASGGVDRHVLLIAQMPAHDHSGADDEGLGPLNTLMNSNNFSALGSNRPVVSGTGTRWPIGAIISNGGGQAHPNVQPSIVRNTIIYAGV